MRPTHEEERVVPATVRPDGTLRKELKVRPGYTPPEDIGRYKTTKAKALDSRPSIPGLVSKPSISPSISKSSSSKKTSKKSKGVIIGSVAPSGIVIKSKIDTGSQNATPAMETQDKKSILNSNQRKNSKEIPKSSLNSTKSLDMGTNIPSTTNTTTTTTSSDAVDPSKKLKALQKKLRQIEQIEEKLKGGESILPEQQEKLSKRPNLEKEIKELEKQMKHLTTQ